MKSIFALAAVALASVLALGLGASGTLRAADVAVQRVDDFQLTDHTRLAHQLYYYGYAPAIVMMTRENGSTVSRARSAELQKIAADYHGRGVLFFLLDSNLADTRETAAAAATKEGLTLPILMDEQQLVGEQLGVKREGEVFVIDPRTWNVAYRGPVPKTAVALDALLAGKPVDQARVELTEGRAVSFPEQARSAAFAKISYAKDIAPILQAKCVSCHLSGGIGPFAMDSYEIVKGFSPMIRETIRTRRMPPYFADPHIGAFKNDQGLTPSETKTIVHWVEAGAPRGDGTDPLRVNATRVAAEWPENLGKPDVVDLGCGDFKVGSQIRPLCGRYTACDVVPELIDFNRGAYEQLDVDFRVLDITADALPEGDVVFVRQVFQHLSNAAIAKAMAKIVAHYKYLVLTEHVPALAGFVPNVDIATGAGTRLQIGSGVVLTSPPFNLHAAAERTLSESPQFGDVIRIVVYTLP